MLSIEKQIEYGKLLIPYDDLVIAEIPNIDKDQYYTGLRIDAFSIWQQPIRIKQKTILGTKIITIDGFSVDVAIDGDVSELGDFTNFFDAITMVATMLVKNAIENFAEAESLAEAAIEYKAHKFLS